MRISRRRPRRRALAGLRLVHGSLLAICPVAPADESCRRCAGPWSPSPCLHAARKNATDCATCAAISARSAARSSPNRARTTHRQQDQLQEIGARSPEGGPGRMPAALRSSDWASSPKTWATASVPRSRTIRCTLAARSGKRRASATADSDQSDGFGERTFRRMAAATRARRSSIVDARRHECSRWLVFWRTLRAMTAANSASLLGKPRVDRRLSGARRLGDLVDARALETALEKHLRGGVEDPLVDLAGEFAARPAAADKPPGRAESLFPVLNPRPFLTFQCDRRHTPRDIPA